MSVESAWMAVRRRTGRVLGPLTARRTGWWYVTRRGVANRVADALTERPTRAPNRAVDLDEIPARFPTVRVHPVAAAEHHPARAPARPGPPPEAWSARALSVLEIPGGVAFGGSGWSGLDDEHLLVTGAMTRWHQPTRGIRRTCARSLRAPRVELPGLTVDLRQAFVTNYAHALLQGVPALDAIDRAVGLDRADRFLVCPTTGAYVHEMLARFDIDLARALEVPRTDETRYRCETLVVPTFADAMMPGRVGVVEPVRRRFAMERAGAAGAERWFLTRAPGWQRRIVNEHEVRRVLEARGFEPLVMDGRTVAEQAHLLASAEAVVGLHGAAMANVVFARPGTRVLELMPRNMLMWMFARLSVSAGLDYDALLGTEPRPPGRLHAFLVDADMIVDVDELARRVDAMLAT